MCLCNTKLSGYIWGLKLSNPAIPYTLDWKIIDRGRIFNPVTRVCRLCLKEKWHIMHNPDACSLNSRTEIFNSCPHKRWFTFQYASLWIFFFLGIFYQSNFHQSHYNITASDDPVSETFSNAVIKCYFLFSIVKNSHGNAECSTLLRLSFSK